MLRSAGRRALRLISPRVSERVTAAPVPVAGTDHPVRFLWQQQSRSLSSLFGLSRALAAAHSDGGAGSGSFGIATGLELEELEAQSKGKKRFDLDAPRGPFGTKDHPAVVESQFDERIVGCSGGVGEDEHDVTWFKLKKGEEYECPVCTQVFELKVVGPGGLPGAHH